MGYIIGAILAIIVLIIIGLIYRKRIYDRVDQLESWKMDIMERNVASQLSKIKKLNLSGETQEKFESWKERWEYIITKELPNIEEHLFDAEEAADRFLIKKANAVLSKLEETLQGIEKSIESILGELDEWLKTEELSRQEVADLTPVLKALRKKLTQSRYLYGKAELQFDNKLDELEDKLASYH